ncbi:PREDICTED: uncharacterized protein LOC106330838 [Brassica oleracea var. oleracea]|uniref:uncharacterized protein LOC106330838 n=1 Tax=Brassica oleracea var. oleracea TaxID=109376 RepID=UPI0006A6AB50|nr:PREDICTED: uncharacterized protein LOC106330838 [Brassica oleracea var. oleracea]
MVRKNRSQQYADDDLPASQQSVNDLQAHVTALVDAVAALTTQTATPAIRPCSNNRTSIPADSEDEDDNPFAPLQQARRHCNINNNSDSDEEHDGRAWKSSFKIEFPEFKGSTNAEELLDWFVTIEKILEFKEVPLEKCVPLLAIHFHDRAAAWVEVRDSEEQLVMRFIGGLRQQIQFTLNLFRPQSISEAHQQAITIENQSHAGSQPWGTSRQNRTTAASTTTTTPDTTSNKTETAIVPATTTQQQRPGGLRCFSCGEHGHRQSACPSRAHRGLLIEEADDDPAPIYDEEPTEEEVYPDNGQLHVLRRSCLAPRSDTEFTQRKRLFQSRCTINGKVCTFVIDSGSTENVIAADAVQKLDLKDEPHPSPYKLGWIQQDHDLTITRRVLVSFSVGSSYQDEVYCDIAPMDACHLLLGRPWEYDRRVIHDGFLNTYTFTFANRKLVLKPTPETVTSPSPKPVMFLRRKPFIDAMCDAGMVLVLVTKPVANHHLPQVPEAFKTVISDFTNVFPQDLPEGLPPVRDIQHRIDLLPDAALPNRSHYRMSPREHEELRRQVEELVAKGFLRESLSPCAVPALLIPKKDAFKTREGLFEWLVMPFGISNAPSTFMRVMNQALRPFIGKFVVVYFDDILIFSTSLEEHVRHLSDVLTILRQDKFYVTLKKCEFGSSKVHFLGYIVSAQGLVVDPAKISVIQLWPSPTTITEVRSFLL